MPYVILETITIEYDTVKDQFRTQPQKARINTGPTRTAGDQPQVEWRCEVDGLPHNNFAVHFKKSACKKIRGRTITGSIVMDLAVGGQGRPPEHYNYFIAVVLSDGAIYTDDPEIIVW